MDDFTFHNPTRIVFGRRVENRIGEELRAAGIGNVLLLYGGGSARRSGLLDRVSAALNQEGITFVELGGVVSNPLLTHTREGIALARQAGVEAVLAVGGGSVLDEGKAIAVGAIADQDVWEFFLGRPVERALPVFTILTLAATGSEMNGNAVITNEETRQKYNIGTVQVYPRLSLLNPELTCSVGPDYTAYGAVDAVAHLLEAYCTKAPDSRLQDRLVEGLIKTIIEDTAAILARPDDYQARASLMWAATLALNGLTPAGVGPYTFPNHMIEHALSALYNIPHGAGLSIVVPAWMKWYRERNREQFARLGREVFGVNGDEAGIAALEGWFGEINSPVRLSQVGIAAAAINEIAANAHGLARRWGIGDRYPATAITEILHLAV